MFRVRFLNLLVDGNQSNFSIPAKGVAKETGVRGYIDNLSYEFVLDADGGGFLTDSSGKTQSVRGIRIGVSVYNNDTDIDAFLNALD